MQAIEKRPRRPVEQAEAALVRAVVGGDFAIGSTLPGERDLAAQLGVTRPTLREALRRLEQDGWLAVHQGRATQVQDFWREGSLNVLNSLLAVSDTVPQRLVTQLLEAHLGFAALYTEAAVQRAPEVVRTLLAPAVALPERAAAFAAFEWQLRHGLTLASGNPIYTMTLNGFAGFYRVLGRLYFDRAAARAISRRFYADLLDAARPANSRAVADLSARVAREVLACWQEMAPALGDPVPLHHEVPR